MTANKSRINTSLHQQLDDYFQLNVNVSWALSFHQLSKCRNQFIYYCRHQFASQQYYALLFICIMMWIVYISRWNALVRLFEKVSMTSPRNEWNFVLLIILFDVWIKFHRNCKTWNEWSLLFMNNSMYQYIYDINRIP